MGIENDLKRWEKILIYKLWGSNAWHKRWQCQGYYKETKNRLALNSYIKLSELAVDRLPKEQLEYLADRYCNHRFDYLGSGWVSVGYDALVIGVEGFRYQAKHADRKEYDVFLHTAFCGKKDALEKLKNAMTEDYEDICWNRDYKSGYQWDAAYMGEAEALQIPSGADIKTVWELGRLEFLLPLALAALLCPEKRRKYIVEFKNVLLDFFSSNPVGLGVNWILPMEASIRVVNLLLSYDIFCQIDEGEILDKVFKSVFIQAVYEHGRFIYDNLESSIDHKNGNHYYSNIIGLLYVGAYLRGNRRAHKWYQYGKKEYLKETERQFFPDGGNIEASTSYHRLMAEMAVFGMAVLLRKGEEIPEFIRKRLEGAAALTKTITKSSGEAVQLGDNDNSRLVNTVPYGQRMTNEEAEDKYENLKGYCRVYGKKETYFDEDMLNHTSLVKYMEGLYEAGENSFESSFIRAIAGGKIIGELSEMGEAEEIEIGEIPAMPVCRTTQFHYDIGNGKIDWGYFPYFGLYYYKEGNMEFYLYTGGQKGRIRQGHSHNDILHCELSIGGEDILTDSGIYLYIENEKKSSLRGRRGHFVPDYGTEPRKMTGTWGYEGKEQTTLLQVKKGSIALGYETEEFCHYRRAVMGEGIITITDSSEKEFQINRDKEWYSNGYGKLQRGDGCDKKMDEYRHGALDKV